MILSFKQFLIEYTKHLYSGKSGFYSWVNVSSDSQKDLLEFFPELKLTAEDVVDLHVTIMYSKVPVPEKHINENNSMPDARFIQAVKPKEVRWWAGHDGDGYLVLELSPTNLQHMHDKWKKVGAVPTFETFTPHITLKSNIPLSASLQRYIKEKNDQLDDLFEIVLVQEQVEDAKQ